MIKDIEVVVAVVVSNCNTMAMLLFIVVTVTQLAITNKFTVVTRLNRNS